MSNPSLGIPSTDCTVSTCEQFTCYTPCEHSSKIYAAVVAKPFAKQAFLTDLVKSILLVQERLIECMCREDSIQEQGFSVGFDSMQCGLSDYSLVSSPLVFDECEISCRCEVIPTGRPAWVDLSQGEYANTYADLVNGLNCLQGCAGGQSILDILAPIGGKLLGVNGEDYNILLPNDPLILSIITTISQLIPVPVGATPRFYVDC